MPLEQNDTLIVPSKLASNAGKITGLLQSPIALATACILLGAVVRLYWLDAQSLWTDELYTAMFALVPNDALAEVLLSDFHPPIFVLLMRAWMAITPMTEFWFRLPSAILSALAPLLLFVLTRRPLGDFHAAVATALLALSSFCIYYGQEARSYSLLLLLAVGITGCWIRAILRAPGPQRGDIVALALLSAAAALVHLFGFLFAGLAWLWLVLLRPALLRRPIVYVAAGAFLVLYPIWFGLSLRYLSGHLGTNFWITRFGITDVLSIARALFSQPVYLLLPLLPFMLAGQEPLKRWSPLKSSPLLPVIIGAFGIPATLLVFATAVSVGWTVILMNKSMIVLFPFVYVLCAVLLGHFLQDNRRAPLAVGAIAGVALLSFLVTGYPLNAKGYYAPHREQIRDSVQWLWSRAGPNDIVVVAANGPRQIPYFALDIYTRFWHAPARMSQVVTIPEAVDLQQAAMRQVAARAREKGVSLYLYDNHDPHFFATAVAEALSASTCASERVLYRASVLEIHYEKRCGVSHLRMPMKPTEPLNPT